MAEPTARGLIEFAPDGYYEGEPCTCTDACPDPCKGYKPQCHSENGCTAHQFCYGDFLSLE
jgi:hypothetical protein